MTTPTPQDHIATAAALLAQSTDEMGSGQIAASQSSVARAQVHALLAIGGLLTPTPEPAPEPEPTPEPEQPAEPTPEDPDAPLPG